VRMRKLRIPGSSSMIRIEACASALNSAPPLALPGLAAGSWPAGGLVIVVAFEVEKVVMAGFVGPIVSPGNRCPRIVD